MSYDGRDNSSNTPWIEQDINMLGFHYYMTPEIAKKGLEKLPLAIKETPKQWTVEDWPELTELSYFKESKK